MARGRKPDAPALQEAKGDPGRRKGKRKTTAAARAAALAAAPTSGASRLSPPAYMEGARFKTDLKVWNELVPELRELNLLHRLDRYTFAMLCTHIADWIDATEDIKKLGSYYEATGVNEQKLLRLNPAVKVRQIAEKHILEIGAKFGMNPFDRYKLLRDQAAAGFGGLWEHAKAKEDEAAQAERAGEDGEEAADPVGMFTRLGGQRPLPN